MKKEKRTRKVTVRYTEKEYERINNNFKRTTCSQRSQYIRNMTLAKPVIIKYRNESLDNFMEEIILLKKELNAIGNNFNQAVKKLHSLRQISEFRQWLDQYEALQIKLAERTDHINQKISQMSKIWWHE